MANVLCENCTLVSVDGDADAIIKICFIHCLDVRLLCSECSTAIPPLRIRVTTNEKRIPCPILEIASVCLNSR